MTWKPLAGLVALLACGIGSAAAGQPGQANVPPYKAPNITLAQPPLVPGALPSIPADQPTVVFRFLVGEPSDPIDPASLRVWLDGAEQTSAFRVESRLDGGDAWGRLVPAGKAISLGTHLVSARICTSRGLCAVAHSALSVMPAMTTAPQVPTALKQLPSVPALINLLDSARKIVKP